VALMAMSWARRMGLTAATAMSMAAAAREEMATWMALLAMVARAVTAAHSAVSAERAAGAHTAPVRNLVLARRVETVALAGMASSAAVPVQTVVMALGSAKVLLRQAARAAWPVMEDTPLARMAMAVSGGAVDMAETARTLEVSAVLAGTAVTPPVRELEAVAVAVVMVAMGVATTQERVMTELVAPAARVVMAEMR